MFIIRAFAIHVSCFMFHVSFFIHCLFGQCFLCVCVCAFFRCCCRSFLYFHSASNLVDINASGVCGDGGLLVVLFGLVLFTVHIMANGIRVYCLIFPSCNSHFIARHEHEQIRLKSNNNNITIQLKRRFATFLPTPEIHKSYCIWIWYEEWQRRRLERRGGVKWIQLPSIRVKHTKTHGYFYPLSTYEIVQSMQFFFCFCRHINWKYMHSLHVMYNELLVRCAICFAKMVEYC